AFGGDDARLRCAGDWIEQEGPRLGGRVDSVAPNNDRDDLARYCRQQRREVKRDTAFIVAGEYLAVAIEPARRDRHFGRPAFDDGKLDIASLVGDRVP